MYPALQVDEESFTPSEDVHWGSTTQCQANLEEGRFRRQILLHFSGYSNLTIYLVRDVRNTPDTLVGFYAEVV